MYAANLVNAASIVITGVPVFPGNERSPKSYFVAFVLFKGALLPVWTTRDALVQTGVFCD